MIQHAMEVVRVRGRAVQSLHKRGVTWVSFVPIPESAGSIDFAIRKLPGLGLLSGTVDGVRHQHAREDNDDFSFHLNLSGLSVVAARGSETILRDGDAMLLSYTESRTITRPGPVYHRVLRVPRRALVPLVRNIDDAVLRAVPRGAGALSLLSRHPLRARLRRRSRHTLRICRHAPRRPDEHWRDIDRADNRLPWRSGQDGQPTEC